MIKKISFLLLFTFTSAIMFAQTETQIKQIREHFKWINSQKDYVSVELDNNDFINHATDNGASLVGFYKNKKLYKVVETVGLSMSILTNEYYLWDNKLIFVYHTEKQYKSVYDAKGNFLELDYTKTELKYELREYFNNGKRIRQLKKGEPISTPDTPYDFLADIKKYKPMLDNRLKYNDKYNLLQGKWYSSDDKKYIIEFDGLTKSEFYEDEDMGRFKVKIEGENIYFTDLEGNGGQTDEFKILSLTKDEFKITMPSGKILLYKKLN